MTYQPAGGEPESLRDIATRLIDDSKAYLHAELNLVKTTVTTKAGQAGPAIGLLFGALLLVQAALTVLGASLGLLLARWLGLAGGFAVAALLIFGSAGLVVWLAIGRFRKMTK